MEPSRSRFSRDEQDESKQQARSSKAVSIGVFYFESAQHLQWQPSVESYELRREQQQQREEETAPSDEQPWRVVSTNVHGPDLDLASQLPRLRLRQRGAALLRVHECALGADENTGEASGLQQLDGHGHALVQSAGLFAQPAARQRQAPAQSPQQHGPGLLLLSSLGVAG